MNLKADYGSGADSPVAAAAAAPPPKAIVGRAWAAAAGLTAWAWPPAGAVAAAWEALWLAFDKYVFQCGQRLPKHCLAAAPAPPTLSTHGSQRSQLSNWAGRMSCGEPLGARNSTIAHFHSIKGFGTQCPQCPAAFY